MTVVFERWSDLAEQARHFERAGLFVPVPEPPPEPFELLVVTVVSPDGRRAAVPCHVVQIASGAGMALSCRDPEGAGTQLGPLFEAVAGQQDRAGASPPVTHWSSAEQPDGGMAPGATGADESDQDADYDPDAESAWLAQALKLELPGGGATPARAAEPPTDLPTAEEPEQAPDSTPAQAAEPASETGPSPAAAAASQHLHERIRAMSTQDKIRLALHGDKSARTALLKDPNKTIHTYVIQNKRITLDEVRYLAGYRQTSPEVLKRIAASHEWLQNPRVVAALVTNPKTPPSLATGLLKRLPPAELRRIAKSQNTPPAVAAAAKKLVVRP